MKNMNLRIKIYVWLFFLFEFQSLFAVPLAEQFKQTGYLEIYNHKHETAAFDSLYVYFDEFVEFLQKNTVWVKKLYSAKERFIRSKDRNFYSTEFFGFYDESEREGRNQISFYYSVHFHEFICSHHPEFNRVPNIKRFLEACLEIQKPYGDLFYDAAHDLGLDTIFDSSYGQPPILFKVIKYFPSYYATKPHYDGTALTLLLDSTDNQSLLLSSYKSSFTPEDFTAPLREYSRSQNQHSILLIPGLLLTEFSIYPTPHIVVQSGKVRYAAVAFAMRPNYTPKKIEVSSLPDFIRK